MDQAKSGAHLAESTSVLICDDAADMRRLLVRIVELRDGLHVAGEAADGLEAVAEAKRLQPAVILLDLSMPRMTGLEALPRDKEGGTGGARGCALGILGLDRCSGRSRPGSRWVPGEGRIPFTHKLRAIAPPMRGCLDDRDPPDGRLIWDHLANSPELLSVIRACTRENSRSNGPLNTTCVSTSPP